MRIEAEQVSKRYGAVPALKDVSFCAEDPGIVALVGKNGSGKSTLMRLLNGWERPTAGTLRVAGYSPYHKRALRNSLFVDEKLDFDFTLPVRGILEKCAFMEKRFDLTYAQEILRRFGLDSKQRYAQLSKGMKSQFNIALALAFNRPLTLMDEPVSGLDEESRQAFYTMLVEAQCDNPRLFIVSTHLLGEFSVCADTLMVLSRGSLAAYDRLENFETLLVRVRGAADNVDKLTEGMEVYETETFASLKSAVVLNGLTRAQKKFARENNVDVAGVSVSDACVILGRLPC